MSSQEHLFARERALVERMEEKIAGAESADNPLREDFASLLNQYDKLLKQTSRLVYIGDRMQQELNDLNKRLTISEQKYRNIFECATEGIFQAAPGGTLVSANPAMARMLGSTTEELLSCGGKHLLEAPHWRSLMEALERGQGAAKATFMIEVGSMGRWFEISAMSVKDAEGSLSMVDGVISDVTKRKELEEKLRHYATVDGLTGLVNRRHFMELFDIEIKRGSRYGTPLSIMMLDLDKFKLVNDKHGHHAGDLVLQSFAKVARNTLRTEDVVGRLGGEEFCVLMPSVGIDGAFTAANHVREAAERTPVPIEIGSIYFSVSIGIAERCDKWPDPESMLKAADEALYRAKNTGRNRVERAA